MHPSLQQLDHRPWPLPTGPWQWRQSWLDLLFAHWEVPKEALARLIPKPLTIDTHDGKCWIGIVPFRMAGVMKRGIPDLPGLSAFPELNVRTYVEYQGKAGVWFFSLDATNLPAIWAARRFFHLPYYRARMNCTATDAENITYSSERQGRTDTQRFAGKYGPTGAVYHALPGSLEHWLTERYCLYTEAPNGRLLRAEVHHPPWPLQAATADIQANTMLDGLQLPISTSLLQPPRLHFARRVDVVVWNPQPVS